MRVRNSKLHYGVYNQVDVVRIGLVGAGGRLGSAVRRLLEAHTHARLAAVLHKEGRQPASNDVPHAFVIENLDAHVDVWIDFSAPAGCAGYLPSTNRPYVVASTGLTATDEAAINSASNRLAVLQAANTSIGVTVMLELVELASRRLSHADIEISEIHHRHKRDAPSGTALALGEAVQRGAGARESVLGRGQTTNLKARGAEELGYAALRGGEVVGEHTVFYFSDHERVEISHKAASKDLFADGALKAACWLCKQPPGRYAMTDVLGLHR